MNFNPNNQNTLLTKNVAALYEAMQKAGDSDLAFMVVDSLNSLANYAKFLAEQEIMIQQARITMDAASYRIFYRSVDSARINLLENATANVASLNRLCKKYNTEPIAGDVADAIEAEMKSGNMYSPIPRPTLRSPKKFSTPIIRPVRPEVSVTSKSIQTLYGAHIAVEAKAKSRTMTPR